MDEKDDKNKESIDDILSDLNELLNRMPSILDSIKMPPLEPLDFKKPANVPAETRIIAKPVVEEQTRETVPSAQGQDYQIQDRPVLPAYQTSDPLYSPAEKKPDKLEPQSWKEPGRMTAPEATGTPESEAHDMPELQSWPAPGRMTPPPSSGPEGPVKVGQAGDWVTAPEAQDRPVVQSLGDYMFSGAHEEQKPLLKPRPDNLDSEKKHIGLPPPITLDAQAGQTTAKDETSGLAPLIAAPLFGNAGPRDIEDELSALQGTSDTAEAGNQAVPYTETGFAELSSEVFPPPVENEQPLPVFQPEDSPLSGKPAQVTGPDHTSPRPYEATADFGIPDIDALFKISQSENPAVLPAAEPAVPDTSLAADAAQAGIPLPPEASHTLPAGNLSDNSSAADNAGDRGNRSAVSPVANPPEGVPPRQASVTGGGETATAAGGGETVADTEVAPMVPNKSNPAGNGKEKSSEGDRTPAAAPASESAEQTPAGGLVLENPGSIFPQKKSSESGKTPAAAPASESAEQTPAGAGEPASAPVSKTAGPPAGGLVLETPGSVFSKGKSPEGDKTIVVAPSAAGTGEEHTVIHKSGPDITSRRMKGEDLAALSQKQAPEGVTEERTKSLAFLYPEGEEWFCAEVLSELDAICLKSPSKPMFLRRAFVKVFELKTSPNFVFQTVSDAKAAGLIFAGTLSQDKVSELESVFSSSGGLFRHLSADSFSHSSALDLVSELILR